MSSVRQGVVCVLQRFHDGPCFVMMTASDVSWKGFGATWLMQLQQAYTSTKCGASLPLSDVIEYILAHQHPGQ